MIEQNITGDTQPVSRLLTLATYVYNIYYVYMYGIGLFASWASHNVIALTMLPRLVTKHL